MTDTDTLSQFNISDEQLNFILQNLQTGDTDELMPVYPPEETMNHPHPVLHQDIQSLLKEDYVLRNFQMDENRLNERMRIMDELDKHNMKKGSNLKPVLPPDWIASKYKMLVYHMPIKVILLKLDESDGKPYSGPCGEFYWVSKSLRKYAFKVLNPEWEDGSVSNAKKWLITDNAKGLVDLLKSQLTDEQKEKFEKASEKKRSGASNAENRNITRGWPNSLGYVIGSEKGPLKTLLPAHYRVAGSATTYMEKKGIMWDKKSNMVRMVTPGTVAPNSLVTIDNRSTVAPYTDHRITYEEFSPENITQILKAGLSRPTLMANLTDLFSKLTEKQLMAMTMIALNADKANTEREQKKMIMRKEKQNIRFIPYSHQTENRMITEGGDGILTSVLPQRNYNEMDEDEDYDILREMIPESYRNTSDIKRTVPPKFEEYENEDEEEDDEDEEDDYQDDD